MLRFPVAAARYRTYGTMADDIAAALKEVRGRIGQAVEARGSGPAVRLVAVSKTKPNEDVIAAYEQEQRHFGENYIDELTKKAAELPEDIKWHFIGHLQSNKAKQLAGVRGLYVWETCSSEKTAAKVNRALEEARASTPLNVYLQINTSGEDNKNGAEPGECAALYRYVRDHCKMLRVTGLMTIGMFGRPESDRPNPDFVSLLECRRRLCDEEGLDPSELELSMGMSDDFEHAIELGSTNVRVGSTIFGARNYNK